MHCHCDVTAIKAILFLLNTSGGGFPLQEMFAIQLFKMCEGWPTSTGWFYVVTFWADLAQLWGVILIPPTPYPTSGSPAEVDFLVLGAMYDIVIHFSIGYSFS